MMEESKSDGMGLSLLRQIEVILESDPLIDEVGFVHPSQFVKLNKEVVDSLPSSGDNALQSDGTLSSEMSKTGTLDLDNPHFWNKDHKLGISTQVLLPLYKAAKHAFMGAIRQYETLRDSCGEYLDENIQLYNLLETDVMKHSKALLLLSCDFGTAWNSRKLVVSKKQQLSNFMDELILSSLVLSYSPKSDHAWSHRRWVIKMIAGKCSTLQDIVGKESELVEKIAERSKMNYRAWNHRCWLVSYLKREQVLHELKRSRIWAGLHIADNCCFHYRRRLMLMILDNSCDGQETKSSDYGDEIYRAWKDELDWDEMLIKRYVGREALWLHRRFLSLYWIKNFATDIHGQSSQSKQRTYSDDAVTTFVDNEFLLLHSCLTIPDNDFEDYEAQAIYSATYIFWLTKQIPQSQVIICLQEKLRAGELVTMLNKLCPERSFLCD